MDTFRNLKNNGNVGIGTAEPEAILDLDVSSKIASNTHTGFLPPRMTEAQRNAIVNPPQGSVVYNTTPGKEGLNHYDGTSWKAVGGGNVKAWVVFDGETGNTATKINSYNVDSVVRDSEATYTINWTPGTFSNNNYVISGVARGNPHNDLNRRYIDLGVGASLNPPTINSIQIQVGGEAPPIEDSDRVSIMAIGN